MTDLSRRVSLLEEETKGEKSISRHMLRKITENEHMFLDMKKEMVDLRRELGEVRNEIVLLRADLPGIIAASIAPFFKNDR